MKRSKNLYILFFILLSCFARAQTYPPNDPNWTNSFTDSFNGSKSSIWSTLSGNHIGIETFETGQVGFNTETIGSVTRDYLQLTATNKIDANGNHYYASGGLQVPYNTSSFYYGYYEIEARVSVIGNKSDSKLWPAFWMWNSNTSYGWYEEMDIFESGISYFPYDLHNVHIWYLKVPPNTTDSKEATMSGVDMTNWHTYGVLWEMDKIVFFLDGVAFYTALADSTVNFKIPCHANKYLLIDLQVGANDPIITSGPLGTLDVNYFKYYKLNQSNSSCSNLDIVNITSNSDLSNYTANLKKSITIGGVSNISLSSGSSIIMRATDEFNINGDFTVPSNSSLELIPTICPTTIANSPSFTSTCP